METLLGNPDKDMRQNFKNIYQFYVEEIENFGDSTKVTK